MKNKYKWLLIVFVITIFGISISLEAATTEPKVVKPTLATIDKKISDLSKKIDALSSAESTGDEFVLISDREAKSNYTVPALTCKNGVRVIARLKTDKDSKSAELSVVGISIEKGKTMVNKIIPISLAEPIGTAYLPSTMILNNETVFPEYQISGTKNADKAKFDTSCY